MRTKFGSQRNNSFFWPKIDGLHTQLTYISNRIALHAAQVMRLYMILLREKYDGHIMY